MATTAQTSGRNMSGSRKRAVHEAVHEAVGNVLTPHLAKLDAAGGEQLVDRLGHLQLLFGKALEECSGIPPGYSLARKILGDDLISHEDIAKVYPDLVPHNLSRLPREDDLRWLKANNYMLVARPRLHLTLLDIRQLDRSLFHAKTVGWYETESFAKDEGTGNCTQWLAIKKTPVNSSTNKDYTNQLELLSKTEHVPNAAQFAWAVIIYYKVRGVHLFSDVYCRTSSITWGGGRVILGVFGTWLSINTAWAKEYNSRRGLASCRNF